MHKAGGLIALISGFFCIAASILAYVLSYAIPMIDPTTDSIPGLLYLLGGIFVSGVVIVLASIILNTPSRIPGVLLLAFSVFAITANLGGGFITLCLIFAIIGGVLALFRPKPTLSFAPRSQLAQ